MPTASDMARLGSTLISDFRQRNAAINAVRTAAGAMKVETRQFVGHLEDQDVTRKNAMAEHAAQTGRFVGRLHAQTRARKRNVQRHAAQTERFVGQLHAESRSRNRAAQQHAAQTGHFMGQLHSQTRARKRDVRRQAGETADFLRYLHGVSQERKHEVVQLLGQAQGLIAGLSAITKQAQAEWRRQRTAMNSARRAASGGKGRASPRGGVAHAAAASEARAQNPGTSRGAGDGVLAYVAGHPGTRLPQMEQALGLNRLEAARTVRALLDQGRIRRDEETRQYFPA
jgi:Ser/Thr protein kinase RdoA (MazF antagonist)